MRATKQDANQLFLEGIQAFSAMESRGLAVDRKALARSIRDVSGKMELLTDELKQDPIFKQWRKRYGSRLNLDSREQLSEVIFRDVLGSDDSDLAKTKTGRLKADAQALENVAERIPFVASYLRLQKLAKAKNTYLEGIRRLVCRDGRLRPSFSLHNVRTYRGACADPNFQNIPIRDPEIGRLIRSLFIPPRDEPGNEPWAILEVDYAAIEVRIAACYNRDPRLIDYIKDPEKDMHRDMAAQCYRLKPSEVEKGARYCGKNMFVFPEFYGDYWANCARQLWAAIPKMGLSSNGRPLSEILKARGIKELGDPKDPRPGSFMAHVRAVEEDFWGRRFSVYAEWKRRQWAEYQRRGYLRMLTGFEVSGVFDKNQILNSAIQGTAFHCLLWSAIHLRKELLARKLRSYLVANIHDCLLIYGPMSEMPEVHSMAVEVMTRDIVEQWPWLIVPLLVEADVATTNWHEKRPYHGESM